MTGAFVAHAAFRQMLEQLREAAHITAQCLRHRPQLPLEGATDIMMALLHVLEQRPQRLGRREVILFQRRPYHFLALGQGIQQLRHAVEAALQQAELGILDMTLTPELTKLAHQPLQRRRQLSVQHVQIITLQTRLFAGTVTRDQQLLAGLIVLRLIDHHAEHLRRVIVEATQLQAHAPHAPLGVMYPEFTTAGHAGVGLQHQQAAHRPAQRLMQYQPEQLLEGRVGHRQQPMTHHEGRQRQGIQLMAATTTQQGHGPTMATQDVIRRIGLPPHRRVLLHHLTVLDTLALARQPLQGLPQALVHAPEAPLQNEHDDGKHQQQRATTAQQQGQQRHLAGHLKSRAGHQAPTSDRQAVPHHYLSPVRVIQCGTAQAGIHRAGDIRGQLPGMAVADIAAGRPDVQVVIDQPEGIRGGMPRQQQARLHLRQREIQPDTRLLAIAERDLSQRRDLRQTGRPRMRR